MSSLVIELQREALDPSVNVTDLLRKALVVSKKLDLPDFSNWISNELDGYRGESPLPAYRKLRGEIKVLNPVLGWIPVIIPDSNLAQALENAYERDVFQPIGEIVALVNESTQKDGVIIFNYPSQSESMLMQIMEHPMRPALHIQRSQLYGIIDAVRNAVLNWSLQLEKDGIVGKGLTFSPKERKAAAQTQNINYFYGDVSNAQIQQSTNHSTQTSKVHQLNIGDVARFVHDLKQAIPRLSLNDNDRSEIAAEANTIEAQIGSPKPKHNIIRESLHSIRSILENAAGNALGNAASGTAGAALLATLLKLLGVQ